MRADVPTVVRAYLLGETAVLKEHCAPEMIERLSAIIAAQHAQVLPATPAAATTAAAPLLTPSVHFHPKCFVHLQGFEGLRWPTELLSVLQGRPHECLTGSPVT